MKKDNTDVGLSSEALEAASGADYIEVESIYKQLAEETVETIRNMTLPEGYRLSEDQTTLIVGAGKFKERIRLDTYRSIEHPSCPIMDLEWLRHRLSLAPVAITVLPYGDKNNYEREQRWVELLAQLFPSESGGEVKTYFIDDKANVVSEFSWQWPKV